MELNDVRRQNLAPPWPKGVRGNPSGLPGRPRSVFTASFLNDLCSVWAEMGRETMVKIAKAQPATFYAIAAKLIPSEVKATLETN